MSLLKIITIVATHVIVVPLGYGIRMAVDTIGKLCPTESEQFPGYEVEDEVDDLYDCTLPA
ncbi:MAG: hypothetical protein WBP22_03310 [Candidatus Saccharimonas sp.]